MAQTVLHQFGLCTGIVLLLANGVGYGQAAASPWRIQIADPIRANLVRRILDEAARLLADDTCRTLLSEFHDQRGRPLAERLDAMGTDIQTYMSWILFTNEMGSRACALDAHAVSMPGSRVVHICDTQIERNWRQNPPQVVAAYIHEILHSLGLGENPPSSSYITERVMDRCKPGR